MCPMRYFQEMKGAFRSRIINKDFKDGNSGTEKSMFDATGIIGSDQWLFSDNVAGLFQLSMNANMRSKN